MTRTTTLLTAVLFALAACGGSAESPAPPARSGGKIDINDGYGCNHSTCREFELKGPNLYFFCDGPYGVYVTEGDNDDSGKSAAPFVVPNHAECQG